MSTKTTPGPNTSNGEQPSGPSSQLDIWEKVIDPAVDDEFLERANYGVGYYPNGSEYWQQVETFVHGLYATSAFKRKLDKRAEYETKRALAAEVWDDLAQWGTDEDGRIAVKAPVGRRERPRITNLLLVDEELLEDEAHRESELERLDVDSVEELDVVRFDRQEFKSAYAAEAWDQLEVTREDAPDKSREQREFETNLRRNIAIQEVTGIYGDFKAPHFRLLDFKHEASRSREGRLMDNTFQRVKRHEHHNQGGEKVRSQLRRRS